MTDPSTNDKVDGRPEKKQNSQKQHPKSNNNTRACFAKDVSGNKRYIPPRVDDSKRRYWWVGDSRFTGMYTNKIIGQKPNEAVVAHAGKGHRWLTKTPQPTGISLLTKCLSDGDVVILNLGANDISNADSYISTYRSLISKYPNVTFRVLSVNPVYDAKTRYLKNTQVESFNAKLKRAFPDKYIDTYSKIKPKVTSGTTDSEGLHYRGGNIEQTIYNTVMSSVGAKK